MPRPLKALYIYILCLLIIMYLSGIIRRTSNYIYIYVCVCVCVCVCWILFIYKGSTSYIQSINQSRSPKKNTCWYGTQKLPKNLNIYLHQTEAAIFLATKHEKTIMACSYLNFSIQKINQISKHKQQKMVAFLKNCSVKMTLRLF